MLYLCATPIGNFEDITLRVLRVLSEVDAIYAEDTRHSGLLLAKYDIKKPLISCHEHNEAERAAEIAERLANGENIAYISDAGMPCISDPGHRLICECIEKNVEYTVLPGASAALTALALSGLATDKFAFFGFLPRSGGERKAAIHNVCNTDCTCIIYESPNRVHATLSELKECAGEERTAAVVRELTKIYEEAVRGTLRELCARYEETPPKGECVIVLSAKQEEKATPESVDSMICELLHGGVKAKDVAKRVAEALCVSKNDVYKRVLELKGE